MLRFGDGGMDDDGERSKPKVTIRETIGEDANVLAKVTNLTANVTGKMGDVMGKGLGGLASKFGGGSSWF